MYAATPAEKNIAGGQSMTSLSMRSPTKFLFVIQISLLIQQQVSGWWLRLFERVMDECAIVAYTSRLTRDEQTFQRKGFI